MSTLPKTKLLDVAMKQLTDGPASHFCGFHDIAPWSPCGRYVLALEAEEREILPRAGEKARIIIVDLCSNDNPVTVVAETRAWNWHLAARQQWVGDKKIIYNDLRCGRHVAIIRNIEDGSEQEIERAVWSVSKDGCWAIAPSFARLRKYYNEYGYAGSEAPSLDKASPDDDGIYLIDLNSGASKLLFSVEQIVQLCFEQKRPESENFWLTHPTFNEDATRFCFYLRSLTSDQINNSNFLVSDREGSSIKLLAQGTVSHFDWYDPRTLVIFIRRGSIERIRRSRIFSNRAARSMLSLARSAKRLIYGSSPLAGVGGFFWLNVETGQTKMISHDILPEDGHNMFAPNRSWMVCDSYPDRHREASLFLYDLRNESRIDIGKFATAKRIVVAKRNAGLNEARCDLHPRWDRTGKQICIDWAPGETRQVYVLDVEDIVSQQPINFDPGPNIS